MSQISTAEAPKAARTSTFSRLTARLSALSFAQKATAILTAAVLILGAAAIYWFATQPRMTPVYTGLDPADASEIVEQLRTDGVQYELTGGGTTVMVPEEHVYEARIRAASEGLPNSARGGYGLLDDMGVTSSDFQQSVTYKRALEGELAGTIEALDAVQTASVALSIPEETVFADTAEDATASIFVRSAPGESFTDRQVHSVSHLVAAAVDGLDPENVAVVDGNGELLAGVGAEAAGGGSGAAADYEERVSASVEQMLDTVVGRGNSTVIVNAAVSQESSELLEEIFEEAGDAPPLTESTNTEEYTGNGGGGGGVLGPDNIAVPGQGGGEGSYTSEQTELQNAVNKVTQTTNIPAGILNRQTISVAVDEAAAAGVSVPMLTDMITDAVGLDEERGDALNVSIVPFSAADADSAAEALAAAEAAAEEERRAQLIRNAIQWGAAALIGMVALVIFMVMANRRRRREESNLIDLGESFHSLPPGTADQPTEALPTTAPQPTLVDLGGASGMIPPPPAADEPGPSREAGRAAQQRAELNALAAEDPARMADHLRALMDQESARL